MIEIFYLDPVDGQIKNFQKFIEFDKKDATWVRLVDPSDEEIEDIARYTNIAKEEFADFLEDEERSRIEQGKYLQIIYRTPIKKNNEITTASFTLFFMGHMFITVERDNTYVFERLAGLFRAGKLKLLFKKSAGYFVYYTLDKINDEFLKSVHSIGSTIDKHKMELENYSEKQLKEIYSLNISLSHFNHALVANMEVLNTLRKSYLKVFNKIDLQRFSDLYYDVLQIIDTEKIERDVLSTMFNFQTIIASYRLNQFIKRLTSLTLLVAIPTLIASFYGMNVINLPFANHPWGYLIIFIGMFTISIMVYSTLKIRDWF